MSPMQPNAVRTRNLSRKFVLILFPDGLYPFPKVFVDGVREVSGYG